MLFRIGVNLGDVIEEESRIYGDGVNIAARLESLAEPRGICVSKTAFDQIETKLPFGYEFLGEQTVKNIAKPVGAYRVVLEPRVTKKKGAGLKQGAGRRIAIIGLAAALVVVAGVTPWQSFLRPAAPPPAPFTTGRTYAFPTGDSAIGAQCLGDCGPSAKTRAVNHGDRLSRGDGHARAGTTPAGVNG